MVCAIVGLAGESSLSTSDARAFGTGEEVAVNERTMLAATTEEAQLRADGVIRALPRSPLGRGRAQVEHRGGTVALRTCQS